MQEKDIEYSFNLGDYQKQITTSSTKTQIWFNRALLNCYGFNHDESIWCCDQALKFDSECSMVYSLKAIAAGINYNNCNSQLTEDQAKIQFECWQKADQYQQKCSDMEKDIINALKFKVGDGKTLIHAQFDKDYSLQMSKVYEKYSNDPFICELYAESLMNLRPWDLWSQKNEGEYKYGDPFPVTLTICEIIKKGLDICPSHPGLRHLNIHLYELSLLIENAQEDNFQIPLWDITPDLGHLCHMPSHIYSLLGKWELSIKSNQVAIEADNKYFQFRQEVQGLSQDCFYTLYRCHNIHFVIYSGLFAGNYKISLEAAISLQQLLPKQFLKEKTFFPQGTWWWLEGFLAMILHVYLRFGKYQEILDHPFGPNITVEQLQQDSELYAASLCLLHFARSIAYSVLAGKNNDDENMLKQSLEQLQKFETSLANIKDGRTVFNNSVQNIYAVGIQFAWGEYEYRRKNYEKAFDHLRKSSQLCDNMRYDEPWGWMVPPRHALCALLLEQGILQNNKNYIQEAQKEYEIDLGICSTVKRSVAHPDNIWSLTGLQKCLQAQQKQEEAQQLNSLIQQQRKISDIDITKSCQCSLKNI